MFGILLSPLSFSWMGVLNPSSAKASLFEENSWLDFFPRPASRHSWIQIGPWILLCHSLSGWESIVQTSVGSYPLIWCCKFTFTGMNKLILTSMRGKDTPKLSWKLIQISVDKDVLNLIEDTQHSSANHAMPKTIEILVPKTKKNRSHLGTRAIHISKRQNTKTQVSPVWKLSKVSWSSIGARVSRNWCFFELDHILRGEVGNSCNSCNWEHNLLVKSEVKTTAYGFVLSLLWEPWATLELAWGDIPVINMT